MLLAWQSSSWYGQWNGFIEIMNICMLVEIKQWLALWFNFFVYVSMKPSFGLCYINLIQISYRGFVKLFGFPLQRNMSFSKLIINQSRWTMYCHDDVIKWKHFPRYWPFVRGIHRSPVNSPHKGQWRGALMLSLIRAWLNAWVNNRQGWT